MMKPITVETDVARSPEEVYAFLDDLGNHAQFTDHFLVDWSLSGPRTGVGAKARARAKTPGPKDFADFEVVEAEPPRRIVERSVGAKGRRVMRGTYTLEPAAGGGTHVRFELVAEQMPGYERALGPLLRAYLRSGNARAMERLSRTLG